MRARLVFLGLTASLGVTLALAAADGCSSYDPNGITDAVCPPFQDFRAVSSVVERRCGTMDCHGSMARPLRIFGQSTLRRPEDGGTDAFDPAEYFTGGKVATTEAELGDNYRSLCGLEPEITSDVVKGRQPVEALTLVRKERLLEKHKGGRVFFEGELGDKCLVSWLHGAVDHLSCEQELVKP